VTLDRSGWAFSHKELSEVLEILREELKIKAGVIFRLQAPVPSEQI